MKKLMILVVFFAVSASQGVSDVPKKSDSEFIFARVQFNMRMSYALMREREAPWHHDYPFAEDLYLNMLQELTGIHTTDESFQIVQLDSRDIFRYPFLYVSEPGFIDLTPKELVNLREYLNRGGFVMCDDFRGADLDNLKSEMKRVFPDRDMYRLDITHPIFNSFYKIESLKMDPPYMDRRFGPDPFPQFWALNDSKGRLQLIANQNNDLGEFWEWVDKGEMPFKPAAMSVRLGVNYLIYAMTH